MSKMSFKLYIGPMGSGKTLELITIANKLSITSIPYVTISYDGQIATRFHDISITPDIITNSLVDVDIPSNVTNVIIDELQFYDGAKEFVINCIKRGINIYAACLNSTYRQHMFTNIVELLPYASIQMCEGICNKCGNDAYHSVRTNDDSELISLDKDIYSTLCNSCLLTE